MGDRAIGLDSVTRTSDPSDGDQPPPLPLDPEGSERAKRAASYELSDAYFANEGVAGGASCGAGGSLFGRNGIFGPNCRNPKEYESYDYERCEPRGSIKDALVFVQQSGDIDAVDPKDVRQWNMGDCHLMAALAALASTAEGRALIHGAITPRADATGQITYDVKLFKSTLIPPGQLTPVTVTVDGKFVGQHALAPKTGVHSEIWPLVIEQAYAVLNGGENRIARGGSPSEALMALTGKPAKRFDLSGSQDSARVPPSCGGEAVDPIRTGPYSLEDLKRDLAGHRPVVLQTVDSLRGGALEENGDVYPEEYRLVGHHAYAVLAVTEDGDGRAFLMLKNPWNDSDKEPDLVPFEELPRWFKAVDVGELP